MTLITHSANKSEQVLIVILARIDIICTHLDHFRLATP